PQRGEGGRAGNLLREEQEI
nr:RecName: Full=Cucurmoschin [Cucurbita maxima]